jgi:hypothetical protein
MAGSCVREEISFLGGGFPESQLLEDCPNDRLVFDKRYDVYRAEALTLIHPYHPFSDPFWVF